MDDARWFMDDDGSVSSRRRGTLPLVLGVGVVTASIVGLMFVWLHLGHESIPISTRGHVTLSLNTGTYTVYRDAGDKCFNDGRRVAVRGPMGRVAVSESHGGTSVNDLLAQVFLHMELGAKFPQAKFQVPTPGSYTVTIQCAPTDHGAFVGPTEATLVGEVRPWLIGLVVGTGLAVWGTVSRSRHPPAKVRSEGADRAHMAGQDDSVASSRAASLSDLDRDHIRRALKAAVSGPYFPEWEIQTLTGFEREELAAVLAEWPHAVVTSAWNTDPDEVQRVAVSNVLDNLLGYPHGEEKRLEAELGFGSQELLRLLVAWRGETPTGYVDALE